MTAYQAMLANQAKILNSMVTPPPEPPVIPWNIGLKSVLTGSEMALPSEDISEVERRFHSIRVELKATGELEEFFARRVAAMTVRVERSVRLESANLADKVRRAVTDFDANRFNEALRLYDWITADPAANSGKLHETIEGVDRMLKAFRGLKDDLLQQTRVLWDWRYLEKVENLMGRRLGDLPISRAQALSDAVGGEFKYLEESDGAGLTESDRKQWARERLAELIDREVERLEAHRTTFDLEEVSRERTDSIDRVLFDPSKEATQARKYEGAAERSLYKALRELRQLQKAKARDEPQKIDAEESELGSFFPGDAAAEPTGPGRPGNPSSDRSSKPSGRSKDTRKPPRSRST
jgi:hypothetical protein